MNKLITSLAAFLVVIFSGTASAFNADYTVSIKNVDTVGLTIPRLVAISNFENTELAKIGYFTIYYDVTETLTGSTIYTGSATINYNETQVVTGNNNLGKITMTYDPNTDSLKTKFVIKLSQASQYDVTASNGFWSGSAQLINTYLN